MEKPTLSLPAYLSLIVLLACSLLFSSCSSNPPASTSQPGQATQTVSTPLPPTQTPTVTPTAAPRITYLADIAPADIPLPIVEGWDTFAVGNYQLDQAGIQPGDPLTAHGATYNKGFFIASPSTMIYDLDGQYDSFHTTIMISDKQPDHLIKGAHFRVDLDGTTAYLSPEMFSTTDPIQVDLNVQGVKTMRLEVLVGTANYLYWPDGTTHDWSIWGDPYLITNSPQTSVASAIIPPQLLTPKNPGDPIAEFYIAPDGNDANPGTITAPFATLAHARDVIRTIDHYMQGPINVYLRGGLYQIPDTLVFDGKDSGNNGFSINYQAYTGETPIISGGKEIKGAWQAVAGKPYYELKLSSDIQPFRNLYVDGQRATLAYSEVPIIGSGWAKGDWSTHDGIVVSSSYLPETFARPEDLELHWNLDWVDARAKVQSITKNGSSQDVIQMQEPYFLWQIASDHSDDKWRPRWSAPFYLENALELLDNPGEWYYDKSIQMLYYYPRSGEDPANLDITIPQVETLVKVEGTSNHDLAQNITFSGITFGYNSWMQASTYGFRTEIDQPKNGIDGEFGFASSAVLLKNTKNISLTGDRFIGIGSSAINVLNENGTTQIVGNLIQDVSKNAIVIGWPNQVLLRTTMDRIDPEENQNISISNNLIDQIGVEYWGSPAIEYYYGTNIKIDHNYIDHVANSGISLNGYQQGFINANPTSRVIDVASNRIENVNEKGEYPKPFDFSTTSLGGDAGGIYLNSEEPGTTIENNYIENVIHNYTCLYLDGAPVGVTINQNVCDSAPSWIYFTLSGNSSHVQNISADDNYTNVKAYVNGMNPTLVTEARPYNYKPFNISLTNTHYLPDSNWPDAALAIISQAGLQSDYQYLLQYLPAEPSSN